MDRGDYGVFRGETRRVTRRYFKTSAKEFYYAQFLRPADAAIATAIARVRVRLGRARFDAPLKVVSDPWGHNWYGAAELWYKRWRKIPAAGIFRLQERPLVEEMRALGVTVDTNQAVDEYLRVGEKEGLVVAITMP